MTGSSMCQRWRPGGAVSWRRPEDGGFNPSRYGAAPISEHAAKVFVTSLHYSRSYPAARQRYGMFDLTGPAPALVGVAVRSVPASPAVLTSVFPRLEPYAESLELGRFVLEDQVPANGESWFLGQFARLAAAAGVRGLVMFSDPLPRHRADGTMIMPGHVGTIYQATNAVYTGRGTPRTLTFLPPMEQCSPTGPPRSSAHKNAATSTPNEPSPRSEPSHPGPGSAPRTGSPRP